MESLQFPRNVKTPKYTKLQTAERKEIIKRQMKLLNARQYAGFLRNGYWQINQSVINKRVQFG